MYPSRPDFQVGTLVIFPGELRVGIVVERATEAGEDVVGVLLTDGSAGRFGVEQAEHMFEVIGHVEVSYEMHSTERLYRDWQSGYFREALAYAQLLAGFRNPFYLP